MSRSALAEKHPWTLPWWKADRDNFWTLVFIVAIHILAVIGFILFPLPGWRVFLAALLVAATRSTGSGGLPEFGTEGKRAAPEGSWRGLLQPLREK